MFSNLERLDRTVCVYFVCPLPSGHQGPNRCVCGGGGVRACVHMCVCDIQVYVLIKSLMQVHVKVSG